MEGGGRSSFQPPSTGDQAAHQVHYCSAVYISTSKICSLGLGEVCSLSRYGNSSAMVKFLKWRALYKLGCCLSRLVSRVTSLRLARFPSATRNITLLPSAWGEKNPDTWSS